MADHHPTPEGILQLGFAFWGSKALLTAIELDLFTVLAEQPLDAEALTRRLGLAGRGARDLFDALVALGMLEREGGLYRPTAATGTFLDRRRPEYMGGILEMANARLYPFWGRLTEGLRTGLPQNEAREGGDFFAAIYADPARIEGFARAMTGISRGPAAALAQRFPWQRYGSFADIGTAQGAVPVTLAAAHPHLAGIGFDLPPLQRLFDAFVAENGLAGRVRFHPGNFFQDPLPRADVLVMGHILHDFGLPEKKLLLAKARDALPEGGALIVCEELIDDDRRTNVLGLLMSLNMLIETTAGFDFTGADCIGWMREAGFREARAEPLLGPTGMVIGIK
ncbi:MAG: methyltransferase [Dongiaceae bacterium]